jgi:regulator of cell morphogenesis and NO signaling
MTAIDTTTTLKDIVIANPSLARELERRKLDYCCGGGRTLAEACEDAGLDATAVAANLGGASEQLEPAPWSTMDMAELVDHIEGSHHRYLWEELPRLDALLETSNRTSPRRSACSSR